MEKMKKKIIVVIAFLTLLFAQAISAQVYVQVRPVPPPPMAIRPLPPRPNYVWVEGNWRWHKPSRQYVYHEGYWIKPKHRHRWNQGYWNQTPRGYVWVSGRWRRI